MKIGLALGSGGARGWCHIGVLRSLEAMGIKPDVITGCSMGALVGAAYAGGRLDALEDWVNALTPSRFVRLVDIRPSSGGLVAGAEILKMLDQIGLPEDISALDIPFAAVATDMATGREIWLRDGKVRDAVRASVALPGVISPHQVNGQWMLDGGLTNPVPVSVARAMGADVVIAVNPNARLDGRIWEPARPVWQEIVKDLPDPLARMLKSTGNAQTAPGYIEVVSASIDVMTEQIRRMRLAGEPPHVLLNPELSHMSVLEMHRGAEAIAEGRRVTEAQSEVILGVCGKTGGTGRG